MYAVTKVCALLAVFCGASFFLEAEACPLSIAAFNIKTFGKTKMTKPDVVNILKQILTRYDIVLIQEIRDSTETAIKDLLDQINAMGVGTWAMDMSGRLGRSSYKEQYAFFYKPSLVSIVSTYQYPDVNDVFEREPYVALFEPKPESGLTMGRFGFLAIHTKPDDAEIEVDALTEVYNTVSSMWGVDDMLLAGDYNADCSYITSSEWPNVSLRHDPRFFWTIGDEADTTVKTTTDCAYDRLVLAGASLKANYVPNSAHVFNFEQVLGITYELAQDVSDHFPVALLVR